MISEYANYYRGKRVLVTGAGYISAAIARHLSQVECEIVVLRRPSARALPQQVGRASIIDMAQGYYRPDTWMEAIAGVSVVFHLAAQTGSREAEHDWVADYNSSVMPLALMLEACRAADQHPIVLFASSATVMGSPDHLPVSEKASVLPFGIYEIHKLLGELYLANAVKTGQVRGTALRIPNVYGPGPVASSGERGVLNRIARAAIDAGRINIFGDGRMLRDFVFVDDVAVAFISVPSRIDSISLPAYLLGSDQPITLADAFRVVATCVEQVTGRSVVVSHVPPPADSRPIEFRSFYADATAFRKATDWQPTVDFKAGVMRTVQSIQGIAPQSGIWPQ